MHGVRLVDEANLCTIACICLVQEPNGIVSYTSILFAGE